MSNELLAGLATLGIPAFAIGYLMLHRKPAIFRMYSAMLVLGLGYLALTGALSDIGQQMLGTAGMETTPAEPASAPEATPAPAPPPETTPAAEAPVGSPSEPPAEATPSEPAAPAPDAPETPEAPAMETPAPQAPVQPTEPAPATP